MNAPKTVHGLRELIANVVASDPQVYDYAFLGTTNDAYQQQITNPNYWVRFLHCPLLCQLSN